MANALVVMLSEKTIRFSLYTKILTLINYLESSHAALLFYRGESDKITFCQSIVFLFAGRVDTKRICHCLSQKFTNNSVCIKNGRSDRYKYLC